MLHKEAMKMSTLDRIFQRIEGYRDEIITLQSELTSRVALGPDNGGSGEHEKSAYLFEELKKMAPASLEEIRSPDGRAYHGYRPNLVARWDGERRHPTVWVLSHLDIVPPGDPNLWEGDPYRIRVEGDKIFGRGVEDNQHGIVSSYLALKAIRESGETLKRPVGLAMVADEETGSEYGLDYLLKNRADLFSADDLIIVPDGGNSEGTMIEVAEKSMLWLKFIVTGAQCHGSTPEKGKNSLYGAARLIVDLEKMKKQFALEDPLFKPSRSTFEPTKMEGNVPNINTIPGRDVFYMDCRILPRYSLDEIVEYAEKIAGEVAGQLQISIGVETYYRQEATTPTRSDAPVVLALKEAIRRVKGLGAKPMGIGGGTVAAFFRSLGLPAAVWITETETPHQPNEYCLISNIISDAKVFACLYLGG
jgi:succinyl-diaminopimelate desuccinylase